MGQKGFPIGYSRLNDRCERNDFKDEEEVENRTKCHVYDEAAWTAKFGASVNLDFTGDLLKGKAYDGNYWTTFYDAAYGYEINAATTVPARKAFLALDDSGAAHAHSLTTVFDDGQTGISGLTLDLSPKGEGRSYFSLDGRKFDGKPNKAGIYVNSGKKTVIK